MLDVKSYVLEWRLSKALITVHWVLKLDSAALAAVSLSNSLECQTITKKIAELAQCLGISI